MNDVVVDVAVIGSGPSGFASWLGLDRRLSVAILDIGYRAGESLDPRDLPPGAGAAAASRKKKFGSPYSYAYPHELGVDLRGAPAVALSGARGGLSTVWGVGLQGFSENDIAAWGGDTLAMESALSAVLGRVPHVGRHDAISRRFPWRGEFGGEPVLSTRYRRLLETAADTQRVVETESGLLIGAPRLAVDERACSRCGSCLDGCARGALFDAGEALDLLELRGEVRSYGAWVERIVEDGDGVVLEAVRSGSRERLRVRARAAIVAAGAIATPALLQRSGLAPSSVIVHDSQVFYVGGLTTRPFTADSQDFRLAQAYVTTSDPVQWDDVHLSLYDYDPSFPDRTRALISARTGWFPRLPRSAFRRVVPGIGFLSTEVSGSLRVSTSADGRSFVEATASPRTSEALSRVVARLDRGLSHVGVRLLRPATQVPPPGSGYHSGSSLPLGSDHVDEHGRLRRLPTVVVSDSSVAPVVFAGPLTLGVMANAYRQAAALSRSL